MGRMIVGIGEAFEHRQTTPPKRILGAASTEPVQRDRFRGRQKTKLHDALTEPGDDWSPELWPASGLVLQPLVRQECAAQNESGTHRRRLATAISKSQGEARITAQSITSPKMSRPPVVEAQGDEGTQSPPADRSRPWHCRVHRMRGLHRTPPAAVRACPGPPPLVQGVACEANRDQANCQHARSLIGPHDIRRTVKTARR